MKIYQSKSPSKDIFSQTHPSDCTTLSNSKQQRNIPTSNPLHQRTAAIPARGGGGRERKRDCSRRLNPTIRYTAREMGQSKRRLPSLVVGINLGLLRPRAQIRPGDKESRRYCLWERSRKEQTATLRRVLLVAGLLKCRLLFLRFGSL